MGQGEAECKRGLQTDPIPATEGQRPGWRIDNALILPGVDRGPVDQCLVREHRLKLGGPACRHGLPPSVRALVDFLARECAIQRAQADKIVPPK